MITQRDDMVGLDSAIMLPTKTWRPAATSRRSPTRWSSASRATSASARTTSRRSTPDATTSRTRHRRATSSCRAPTAATATPGPSPVSSTRRQDLPRRDRGRVRVYTHLCGAQGIFLNFANIVTSARMKPPFGIAQMGKSFRNPYYARQLHLPHPGVRSRWRWSSSSSPARRRSDQQARIGTSAPRWFTDLGIDRDNLRHFEHPKEKLSHYAKRTVDIEYRFGFSGREFEELEGIASRHRLRPHPALAVLGPGPLLLRPGQRRALHPLRRRAALGPNRAMMALPARRCLRRGRGPQHQGRRRQADSPAPRLRLAPVKVAVLPQGFDLSPKARSAELRGHGWNVEFDSSGAIGRRYRRQDADRGHVVHRRLRHPRSYHAVTVRERDSMSQDRIALRPEQLLRAAPPNVAGSAPMRRPARNEASWTTTAPTADPACAAILAAANLALAGCGGDSSSTPVAGSLLPLRVR